MIAEKLLELDPDTHQATPTDYARTIEPFLQIITRDRGSEGDSQGRKKRKASKELAYIYYMCDVSSPFFQNHREESRHAYVAEAVFGDPGWEPDEVIIQGMKVYKKAHQTVSIQLLESAKKAVHKLRDYLEDIDLTETVDGKLKHNVKDLLRALKDTGAVMKNLEDLEERVQKEQIEETKTRGGVEETPFNQ